MARYAKNTSVPVARSRQKIEELLESYGIDESFMGRSPRGDGIGFKYNGKVYKMNVPAPSKENKTEKQYEQQLRQRWRILYMSTKMKFEEIDAGVISFEDQFLAQMCLPNGSTVADFMRLPENIQRLEQTKMPKLLTK
ncbi:hypothetical protein ES707_22651 [subsurface metagenome]